MLSNNLIIGVIGLASTSAVGLGVYYSGILSTEKVSISSLTQKDDYITVMKGDDRSWSTKWTEYESSSNAFGIKNPSLDNLKKKCSDLVDKGKVSNTKDKLYSDFIKFCTRSKTTKEKLTSLNKYMLDKDNQNSKWQSRFSKYKLNDNNLKFANISSQPTDRDDTDFSKLSIGCHEVADKAWKEMESSLPTIEKWCLSVVEGEA